MATANIIAGTDPRGRGARSPVARAIDRWIYVIMAAWFVVVALIGFVPDSVRMIGGVRSGLLPPLPPILHFHAVLMGSLLLLLLAQTILMATGRREGHQWLGRAMIVLAPAIFVTWLVLVPTTYHQYWYAAHSAHPSAAVRKLAGALDDIFLGQLRVAVLFPVLIWLGLKARRSEPGFHKRMMILAVATVLPPALARMWWLPRPFPGLMSFDLYILLVVSPMFIWDVLRTLTVPKAYLVWITCYALVSIPAYALTGSAWWHGTVPYIMRV